MLTARPSGERGENKKMNWINAYHYTDGINDEAVVGPSWGLDILIQTDSLGLLQSALGFEFFPDLFRLIDLHFIYPILSVHKKIVLYAV